MAKRREVNLVNDPLERAIVMAREQFGKAQEGLAPKPKNPMAEIFPRGALTKLRKGL